MKILLINLFEIPLIPQKVVNIGVPNPRPDLTQDVLETLLIISHCRLTFDFF